MYIQIVFRYYKEYGVQALKIKQTLTFLKIDEITFFGPVIESIGELKQNNALTSLYPFIIIILLMCKVLVKDYKQRTLNIERRYIIIDY